MLTEIKCFKTYLWASNFQQYYQTAYIFLRQTQDLVDSANLQPKLVGWFFFFSCLNLLQRRHKIRFWHTIMILAVLEPEARYVPVRDLVQPSVFDRVWPLQQRVSFIVPGEHTSGKLTLWSVSSTAQKASWCSLCWCHQPCLTELWGHPAFLSLSGSILTNSLNSLNMSCTHHYLLFQYRVTWGWFKSCFDWHMKRLQYETLSVQSKRFTYRWPQNSCKKKPLCMYFWRWLLMWAAHIIYTSSGYSRMLPGMSSSSTHPEQHHFFPCNK